VRQAMESTLVDAANVLAEMAAADLKAGHIRNGPFVASWRARSAATPRRWCGAFPSAASITA
ncbi:hypothetical protein, partial [Pseudomonas viridiflava]|uniref:hypothetical protein n=1 Tax=Pseudomonas viridiflava TaxID=33069 RepID=UPI00197E332E